MSQRTGVQIIAATGIWRDIPRSLWFARARTRSPRCSCARSRSGIEGTGIKAGIIKVANDAEGVTKEGEIILRAAARAAKQTGVRISTHSFAPGRVGEQQVAIFEDEGFDLNRVYIGHSNDSTDLEYLQGLLARGVWLGLDRHQTSIADRAGRRGPGPDAGGADQGRPRRPADGLARLVRAGRQPDVGPAASRTYNPDGWLFAKRKLFPRLRELGISRSRSTS